MGRVDAEVDETGVSEADDTVRKIEGGSIGHSIPRQVNVFISPGQCFLQTTKVGFFFLTAFSFPSMIITSRFSCSSNFT